MMAEERDFVHLIYTWVYRVGQVRQDLLPYFSTYLEVFESCATLLRIVDDQIRLLESQLWTPRRSIQRFKKIIAQLRKLPAGKMRTLLPKPSAILQMSWRGWQIFPPMPIWG